MSQRGRLSGTQEKGVSVKPECQDQEIQTGCTDLQLDVQHTGCLLQVGPNNFNINVQLDKDFLAIAKKGGNLQFETSGKRILTVTWEGDKAAAQPVKSSVRLKVQNLMNEIFQKFRGILNDVNMLESLKTLILSMQEKYNAKLVQVFSGSLIFVFTHEERDSATMMVRDERGVEDIFRTFMCCLQAGRNFLLDVYLHPQDERTKALTYPTTSHSEESAEGSRVSKEMEEIKDSLRVVEAGLANLTQQVTSMSGGNLYSLVKASMFGMTELGKQVERISQRMGDGSDTEGRGRESRPARIYFNRPSVRGTYGKKPVCDQAENLMTEAPRLGEKDVGDFEYGPSTYEEDSGHISEGDWTQSRKMFEGAEDLLRSMQVPRKVISPVLQRCVAAALMEVEKPPPRSESSMDTLLCIDVSGSIGEHWLHEVKQIADTIVDGIQKDAEEHSLEENVGVIAMGNDVRVVQHPTNDYSQVFDAIGGLTCGGRSPIYTALCVCVAALDGKIGSAMSEIHRIRPRVIFITDGYATKEDIDTGPDSTTADNDAKTNIIRLIKQFSENELVPSPIVWIPVGRPDKGFLRSLANLGKGEFIDKENVSSLSCYYRMQESIGRIYFCVKNDDRSGQDVVDTIQNVTSAFIGDMTDNEQKVVVEAVRAKLERMKDQDMSPDDYTRIDVVSTLPPVGTRVVRGPDWSYEDQDSGGPGTIINHSKDSKYVWVKWDLNNETGRYRYGADGKCDLKIIEEPRELQNDELIEIGVKVQRGSDWSHGDLDGGEGSYGVVVRKREDGMVKVRWSNGEITPCKYGFDGKMELIICHTGKPVIQSPTSEKVSTKPTSGQSSVAGVKEEKELPSPQTPHVFWRWKDDLGQWRLYSREATKKLEEEYMKGGRSCLVKKGTESCRVIIQRPFHERRLQGGSKTDVDRILVDDTRRVDLISCEIAFGDQTSWSL